MWRPPLRYLGYTLEWSLVLEHVCAGGGGVMWHSLYRRVSRFIVGVSVVFWTTIRCGVMSVAMTFLVCARGRCWRRPLEHASLIAQSVRESQCVRM